MRLDMTLPLGLVRALATGELWGLVALVPLVKNQGTFMFVCL